MAIPAEVSEVTFCFSGMASEALDIEALNQALKDSVQPHGASLDDSLSYWSDTGFGAIYVAFHPAGDPQKNPVDLFGARDRIVQALRDYGMSII